MCTSAQCYSCVWLFATLWTIACQAPLSMGFSRPRILEWVGISSSRGSSQPRDWTQVSCISFSASRFFTAEPPGRPHWPGQCLNPSMWTLLSPRSGNNLLWLLFQPLGLLICPVTFHSFLSEVVDIWSWAFSPAYFLLLGSWTVAVTFKEKTIEDGAWSFLFIVEFDLLICFEKFCIKFIKYVL